MICVVCFLGYLRGEWKTREYVLCAQGQVGHCVLVPLLQYAAIYM